MTPERWQQIREVFGSAIERAPGQRAAFVKEVCAGDEDLRREVESLLASYEQDGSFLEEPAFRVADEIESAEREVLSAGQTISHYEVISLIGEGGMGEVYLARDDRLGRRVALKLLPARFTTDREHLRRFEREAHAASKLSHPNVCMIHEVGKTDEGRHYIVIEYVEGVTLRDHIAGGRLCVNEVLDIGAQIAAALSAAHDEGIIHRDVKPENVMIRRDGLIKVLDFGLAKLTEPQGVDPEAATKAQVTTRTGMVMGTPSYMSPEQARGLAVDARTDVWSLGVVLYEMVAGQVPFEGETNSDIIVSILEHEPPLAHLSQRAPAELQGIVAKALKKDKADRYQSTKDLALDLKSLKEELEFFAAKLDRSSRRDASAPVTREISSNRLQHSEEVGLQSNDPSARTRESPPGSPAGVSHSSAESSDPITHGKRGPAISLSVLALVALSFALYMFALRNNFQPGTPEPPPKIIPLTTSPGTEIAPALSPDGERVAFAWRGEEGDYRDIYVQQVGAGSPIRLTTDPANDTVPEWSPDGRYVAFTRAPLDMNFVREGNHGVYLIPSLGGAERKVGEIAGGTPWTQLCWSADGNHLAVRDRGSPQEPFSIHLLSIETGEKRRLTSPPAQTEGDICPVFSPDGQMLAFTRVILGDEMDIYVQPLAARGEPRRLTSDKTQLWDLSWTGDGREIVFSSNRTGTRGGLWRVASTGGVLKPVAGVGAGSLLPSISHKGSRLAFVQSNYDSNVWRVEVPGSKGQVSRPTKLTSSSLQDEAGHYAPDGRKIVFVSNRSGSKEIWVSEADGSRPLQMTSLGVSMTGNPRWSPDGRRIVFDSRREGHTVIYVLNMEDSRLRRMTNEASNDGQPSWSHDGRFIYFTSDRGGETQVWKMNAEGGDAVQVTKGGGFAPLESADGKYVYYSKGSIWRVPTEGGEEVPVIEDPRPFSWGYWAVAEGGIYFAAGGLSAQPTIYFYNFATRRTTEIAKIEKVLPQEPAGLSLSPDGKWLLITQDDRTESDIMMVENFR